MKRSVVVLLLFAMIGILTLGLQYAKKPLTIINESGLDIYFQMSDDGGEHWGGGTFTANVEPVTTQFLDDPSRGGLLSCLGDSQQIRYEERYIFQAFHKNIMIFNKTYSFDQLEKLQFTVRIRQNSGP